MYALIDTERPFGAWAILTLLLIAWGLFYSNCSKTPEERLADLALRIKKGEREESLQEIRALLAESNRQHSITLEGSSEKRYLGVSPDGSRIAWIQSNKLYYREAEQKGPIELPGNVRGFNLSWSGRYAVAVLQSGDQAQEGCQPVVLFLDNAELLDQKLPTVDCQHRPAITDNGRYLYYKKAKGISYYPVSQSKAVDSDSLADLPEELSAKKFPVRYKKVPQRFVLHQIGRRGLLIFHGNFGYYKLYFYPGSGKKLKKRGTVFSRPVLYHSYDSWNALLKGSGLNRGRGGRSRAKEDPVATGGEAIQAKELAKADSGYGSGYGSDQAFAYGGGAGKWRLYPLRLKGGLALGRSIEGDMVADNLAFLRDQNQFLLLSQDQLYYWSPLTNRRIALPLAARFFEFYNGGLVYVDLLNRMYLREAPFSAFEMKLMQLQAKALSLLEK